MSWGIDARAACQVLWHRRCEMEEINEGAWTPSTTFLTRLTSSWCSYLTLPHVNPGAYTDGTDWGAPHQQGRHLGAWLRTVRVVSTAPSVIRPEAAEASPSREPIPPC